MSLPAGPSLLPEGAYRVYDILGRCVPEYCPHATSNVRDNSDVVRNSIISVAAYDFFLNIATCLLKISAGSDAQHWHLCCFISSYAFLPYKPYFSSKKKKS
jgi:hypothetical protein